MKRELTIWARLVGTFVSAGYTVRRTLDFNGRSRRSEFLCYIFAGMVLNILMVVTAELVLGIGQSLAIAALLKSLFTLPLFALIARRFHDMGLTGWLALPTLVTFATNVHKDLWWQFAPLSDRVEGYPHSGLILILGLPGIITLLWALIQEGQTGEDNRFGPDPRLDPPESQGEPAIG